MPTANRVFISYSHADRRWLDRLSVHLRPLESQHGLTIWSDIEIKPGDRWREQITTALAETKVAVLLVSASYLASPFITNNELPFLLRSAQTSGTTVVPVILGYCGFLRNPHLREFQAINDPQEPLDKMREADQAQVFERLASLVDSAFSATEERPQVLSLTHGSPLVPEFTFETFVEGGSNQLALTASRAVVERPSRAYNPLFIYSGVGLGKTHLLNAIAHDVGRRHPQLRVLYTTTENFVNELIDAIRHDHMRRFRERYRSADVFIVDDVQFLANKERTQEEFFHCFERLYTNGQQIILSSDTSPRYLTILEPRLRSRFEWGLTVDIQPPDLGTRIAIVQRKALRHSAVVPGDVAEMIARQAKSSIRELEGLLYRVVAFAALSGRPVSRQSATEALKGLFHEKKPLTATTIVRCVAKRYGVSRTDLSAASRTRRLRLVRNVAIYLCYEFTALSQSEVGIIFGGLRPRTVRNSIQRVVETRQRDPEVDKNVRSLEAHLASKYLLTRKGKGLSAL